MTELQELKFLARCMRMYSGRNTKQSDWQHYFREARLYRGSWVASGSPVTAYIGFVIFNEPWQAKLEYGKPKTIFQTTVN